MEFPPPVPTFARSSQRRALSGCYARWRGDCNDKLSREHPLPHVALRHILALGGDGLRMQSDDEAHPLHEKLLPTDAFASRVLCEHHNNQLSPLDDVFGRFAEALLDHVFREARRVVLCLHGPDLERAILKLLCGFVASGYSRPKPGVAAPRVSCRSWVPIVFGEERLPLGSGMWFLGRTIENLKSEEVGKALVQPFTNSSHLNVAGVDVTLASLYAIRFVLDQTHPYAQQLPAEAYRPSEIRGRNNEDPLRSLSIRFTWPDSDEHVWAETQWSKRERR